MILVGDVGGTRTRLALAVRGAGGWQLDKLEDRPTGPDVLEAVARFARASGRLEAASFCGAGPVGADGSIRLTNADLRLVPAELARAAGLPRVLLVNDFQAVARSIPELPADARRQVGGGAPVEDAPVVVLGPGTGLGVAILARCGAGWVAIAGEGGHVDLAPIAPDELEVWERLHRAHGRVSAETVLCGPGLERLYAALADGAPLPVAEIDQAAWRGEPAAVRAHALFARWLGSVAGNLALTAGARGGVFLAGGVLPRWGERFDAVAFRHAFEDKAPHGAWLAGIPTYVVTHPQPGLLGAAVLAAASA